MKYGILLGLLCLLSVASCTTSKTNKAKVEPTSEIPARREFPVNEKADPCKDFYQYACSKVNETFKLREDRSSHTFSFSDSAERILEAKKTFLKDLTSTTKKLNARSKTLRTIYDACMNEEAQKVEEKSIVDRTFKELGDLKSNKEFQAYLSDKILSKDFSYIDIGNLPNQDDPEWDDLYFLSDLQTLPERSYYEKADVTKDLEDLIFAFFKTVSPQDGETRAKAILAFEKEFAQSYPLPAEFRDIISKNTNTPRENLYKSYPSLLLPGVFKHVPGKTKIRSLTPANFEFINKALNEKPIQVLKDVYAFHSLGEVLDDAYPEFFKIRFEFNKKHLGGPNVRPDRQERCTKLVMSRFGKEFDAELLPTMFPNFPEEKPAQLAEKIRASIIKGIDKNQWLSPEGKAMALAKMKNAKLQLVKPTRDEDWDFNPPARYSDKTPIDNIRLLTLNLTKKMLRELNQTRNRTRWGMSPLTVNAYYNPADNKFVLPIGILQYPFYDPNLPERVNMAAMGTVVGHELGHAIDDKGSRYDEKGRLKQWMSDQDLKIFKEKGAQLGSQFKSAGLNPELTMGENVADLVGLTFSYDAAFPDGVGDLAAKREFFTQYGRLWCNVIRPKYLEVLIKTDSHSPGVSRVNEQVKHQLGFAEAFQCKPGSTMTLKDIVRIW